MGGVDNGTRYGAVTIVDYGNTKSIPQPIEPIPQPHEHGVFRGFALRQPVRVLPLHVIPLTPFLL